MKRLEYNSLIAAEWFGNNNMKLNQVEYHFDEFLYGCSTLEAKYKIIISIKIIGYFAWYAKVTITL